MRTIKFMMALLYRYYSSGPTASVAYIKTVGSMSFLTFILVLDLLLLTDTEGLVLFKPLDSNGVKYLKVAGFILPIFLFYLLTFKEKSIKTLNYTNAQIKRGNLALVILFPSIILSLILILAVKY